MNLKINDEVIQFNPLFKDCFCKHFLDFQTHEDAKYIIETKLISEIDVIGDYVTTLPSSELVYTYQQQKIIIQKDHDKVIYRLRKDGNTFFIEISENVEKQSDIEYVLSSRIFSYIVSEKQHLIFHASAIRINQKAVLFVGSSGIGKTTLANRFIEKEKDTIFINDDKPLVTYDQGMIKVFGTPWAGSEGLCSHVNAPIQAIYFLKQGKTTAIEDMSDAEKIMMCLNHTYRLFSQHQLDSYLNALDHIIEKVPMYYFVASHSENDYIVIKQHLKKLGLS